MASEKQDVEERLAKLEQKQSEIEKKLRDFEFLLGKHEGQLATMGR